ncbi:MAG TPA: hypothetical protein VIL95_02535 [Bacillota bacterium]
MYSSYSTTVRSAVRSSVGEARERILLAAAVADLREALYRQQCWLTALVSALEERGLLEEGEIRDRAEAISQQDLRSVGEWL